MATGRGVEVRHLRAFVAVAEELHFGRAAQRLHMAQPPLSQLIRALEGSLDAQLFERTSRSVRITPAGELMLERARGILRDVDRAVDDVGRIGRGRSASLRFGFNDHGPTERIPRIAARFAREHPDIHLEMMGGLYSKRAAKMVRDGELDVALVHGSIKVPGVETIVVLTEPVVATLPARHPAAGYVEVSMRDLADDDWLTSPVESGSTTREWLFAASAAAGFRPRIAYSVEDTMAMMAMVGAGTGVAVVPASVTAYRPPGVVYRPLAGPVAGMDVTVCWSAACDRANVRDLVDTVVTAQ